MTTSEFAETFFRALIDLSSCAAAIDIAQSADDTTPPAWSWKESGKWYDKQGLLENQNFSQQNLLTELLHSNAINFEQTAHTPAPAPSQLNNSTQAVSNFLIPSSKKGEENMKHITKRADGRYQAYKTFDGKRYYVYANTQIECNNKYKNLKKPNNKPIKKVPTLAEYSIIYIEKYKKNAICANSVDTYIYTVKKHLNIKKPLNEITTDFLQDLLNKLPPTRTKENVCMILKQIFRKAEETEIIKKDVAKYLVKGKIQRNEKIAIPYDEQAIILNALFKLKDTKFSKRILFYLLTGARPNEISTVNKKSIKENFLFINGTKNKNAKRWVKISSNCANMLISQDNNFYTFDTHKFRLRFQDFLTKLNLPKYDIYSLRHTFSTNLYYLGVPDKERSSYMGHASTEITNDVYTTLNSKITSKEIRALYGDLYPEF